MANREAVEKWLGEVQIITDDDLAELVVADRLELDELLGHKGMAILLGLMLGARQGLMVQLSHYPLHTAELAAQASVTQGKIKGIDLLWETLLEVSTPIRSNEAQGAEQ